MKNKIRFYFAILSMLCFYCSLSAQSGKFTFKGNYEDIRVPSNSKGKYLFLSAVGGDGGANEESNPEGAYHHPGGRGAYVEAAFEIGDNNNQIQEGGILRFIVGAQGDSYAHYNQTTSRGLGGGGGTGIVYKGPYTNAWKILIVAGGGAGNHWNHLTRKSTDGDPGKKYIPGTILTDHAEENGGGAGAFERVVYKDWFDSVNGKTSYEGWPGGPDKNDPIGGSGHDGGKVTTHSGGWGFGAGGIGYAGTGGLTGGGGGYKRSGEGDPGVSYVNENMVLKSINSYGRGQTENPANGFATYSISDIGRAINWHGDSNWCIDNSGGRTTDGNKIQLSTCGSENKNQKWVFLDDFTIRLENDPSKCLDLEHNNISNNTKIQLYGCNSTSAQKWIFEGTTRMIRYQDNLGYCLTFDKDDASNGSQIYLYECSTGNIGQQWNTEDFSAANLGEKEVASIRPYTHSSKCIDNSGGRTDNGNKIQLWNCSDTDSNDNQKWFFDEDGAIRLSNHRDKCLSLVGGDFNDGDDVHLWDCKGQSNQLWIYDGYSKVIRFRSKPTKCLDLTNGDTSNGTQIQIGDCQTDDTNMQWTLEQSTPNYEDLIFGQFHLTSDTGKCLDLKSGNASNGANIQLWPCNGEMPQNWYVQDKKIKYLGRNGYCLAINGSDNTNVHIWECKDQANEEWIFDIPFKLIRSRVDANKCLVVNGSNIEIGSCNYDAKVKINQQWDLPGGYSEILTGGDQQIHLSKADRKCVDMASGSSGADVRVYDCKNGSAAAAQTFFFDGSRIKRADNHSLCLELEGGKTDKNTDIQLGTCTGSISTQKWMYDGVSGRIHSKADPNKCMRFTNGFTSNYTNIKLSDCNDDQAEIFVIK